MIKNSRKTSVLVILGLIVIPFITAFAVEQRYTSYIIMPGGSNLVGEKRNFSYSNHKITLIPTELENVLQDGYGKYTLVDIDLDKKGLLFWDNKVATGTLKMRKTGTEYTLYMGNKGKGNFRYSFHTGNSANWYGSFTANPVYMYSYE
ncbi:MAG: hypothetical protein SOT41_00525 [Candidatus Faecisoma sp.]|nr:hypothetical protein [Acholeplasma sp.]MDY2892260.1 hypothetical protein [Candidatus Faecisoma sp.]